MDKLLQTWLSVVASLVLFPAISFAMPVVSGNTLNWPDDGWYQVQRADTFETVCEGSLSVDSSVTGGPCVLGLHNYIVINHSSGERFDNITASDVSGSTDGVSVEGGRISWPDDGWYQVQNTDTYATVCEGGRACDVAIGNYVVINHTTGERFEDVRVGSAPETGDNTVTGVTVQGLMLSWPDDGWYQVQSASNYSTVCEGGTSCTVQPGNYVVINHSTGERFNNIEVGTGNSSENSVRPASVMTDGNTIRWPDDGWYQVQTSTSFTTVCEGGAECPVSDGSYIVINHTTGERTVLDVGNSTSEETSTTRVNFDITVPAYMSDALQVRLVWGDVDTTAMWNRDELWTASVDFPANTTNQLVVTFSDNNGSITLGSVERSFTTGANPSESLQIAADEFDTDRWDSDGDGVSNLSESIAGTNPQGSEATLEPVQASLELVQDKTFRISWQQSEGAQFYRVLENPDGVSGFNPVSNELDPSTMTFDHRVALYGRFDASYIVQSCNANGCIDSDELIVSGTLEQAIGYFKAENTEFESVFGSAFSFSVDGNTLAVGASGSAHTDERGESDFVYVFQRSNGGWLLQDILRPNSDDASSDGFGRDVSLAADGNTLAVGAFHDASVYVFERTDSTWQQQAYLENINDSSSDFGIAVSLDAEGNTLAVGASAATGVIDDPTGSRIIRNGVVYVFERSNGTWQQQADINASNAESFEVFGRDVSLSSDGNTLAVGAIQEDSAATGVNGDQNDNSARTSGAVYVFEYSNGIWQQQAYLKASNTEIGDAFGISVSLSSDSNTLAVGATGERSGATGVNGDQNDNSAVSSGAVYVFERSNETWQQQAYLKASNVDIGDSFGGKTSLSADGNILAVSAGGEDSAATGVNGDQNDNSAVSSGAVYVFERSNGTWQQQAYLKASNGDENDRFGALGISPDGNTLAVGAASEDSAATGVNGDQSDNSASGAGAVYLY